jgi:hypothetical protein
MSPTYRNGYRVIRRDGKVFAEPLYPPPYWEPSRGRVRYERKNDQ